MGEKCGHGLLAGAHLAAVEEGGELVAEGAVKAAGEVATVGDGSEAHELRQVLCASVRAHAHVRGETVGEGRRS